ncbi:EAL domain-containing protein [Dechloromonas sp. TW-R-39-2]|uniref:putative bifunctional diguanylate cyclase/phosphodiesterase n=1 Tax=Dechloromonas sp. TW-R-39-2 TaxID=2654218 RepID=UPI00193E83B4|nr:EAL domain-containing protein [Dechloromonas sp. TW-R-39-2]QRM20288.1 EAL domain-containing protein [Dechloromonas sp. TW-R-39-2]
MIFGDTAHVLAGHQGGEAEYDALFDAAMAAAQVGIFIHQDGRFKYANAHLLQLIGYSADELIDRMGPLDLLAPGEQALFLQHLAEETAGISSHQYELSVRHKDGESIPVSLLGRSTRFNGRAASVASVLNISAQREAERQARELADFDALTGLPNRRLLADRMVQLLAVAEREQGAAALIFLDLDHFKRINDSLGHSLGDELLCAVAQRLSTVVRRVDTLARLGGDEFVFALPSTHSGAAAEIARRLVEVCNEPFFVGGHELTVTASLGISLYPQDGKDAETLLKNADTAMYKAKEQGRNAFQFYASAMNTAMLERLLIESDLRRALRLNEFTLDYQPLVSLQSGLIVGVEALVRWRHPELGIIMPDSFIQVAEETGMINRLGDWVLGEACRQAQAWCDAGLPQMIVAVNVAPVQFRQAGFVEAVAGALAASGLEAGLLELEVTERTVMHDAEIHLGTLSSLNRMGVELSLDDFGTGYSSLAYLKRFPVGKLKIDRSFIRDLENDPDDRAIASTIISMGRNLRLTVLAEGVENAQQLALLRDMGCDMAQGYYFSRPLPAGEMTVLLRQQPFLNKE